MTFLADYREYCAGSEAHPTYHLFSGLVALSSIISRKVWIDMGYFSVYPNLYVIIVGPAGNRKTSAMSVAKKLLRELKVIPFSAECVTKEKLILDIADQTRVADTLPEIYKDRKVYSPMTVMVTELSEFLGAGGIGMINFLTTIYDQDFYDHRTKNKGDVLITGPFLNVLACTTPDWITSYLRTDVISGGFSRRAIFVLETGKSRRIAFPEVTGEMQAAWERLLSRSRQLLKVAGPFTWEPEARTFFEEWYKGLEMPTDDMVIGYFETKHIQLLKVSMLLALSESSELVLRKSHLLFGLELLKLAEDNLSRVFSGIGRNELNAAASKVLDILRKIPPTTIKGKDGTPVSLVIMPETRLRAIMFRDVATVEFNSVIQHLIDTGTIERMSNTANNTVYIKLK